MSNLYRLHYAPDNASLIVRLTLEEIGVAYETQLVDRRAQAHKSPEYRALNPAGVIPVLETPQGPIFETGAIILWLADQHGALAPAPTDPDRAAFLKWLFFIATTLHSDLRQTFYPGQYIGPDASLYSGYRTHIQTRLRQHLALIEDVAAKAPVWFCAATPSVLVFYVACLVRWMAPYPGDGDRSWFRLDELPNLQVLLISLEHRASVLLVREAEGLGATPFTKPTLATPPEGNPT